MGTIVAFLVGTLTGLLVIGLAWGGSAVLSGDIGSPRSGTPTVSPGSASGVDDESGGSTGSSRLDSCRRAHVDLSESLRLAAPALTQWQVHVSAMNQLVLGAITLQQAKAFWDQSRVGAQRRLDRFHATTRPGLPGAGVCPAPSDLGLTSAALRACADLVDRERRALGAARVAMSTWRTHVRHMEMLRTGRMSPSLATRLWLASWHQGVGQLHRYRRAQRGLDGDRSC